MPYEMSMKQLVNTVSLVEIDPSGETTATVRQATTGDMIAIGNTFGEQTQIFDDGDETIKIKKKWNPDELKRYRCWRCLIGCNIVNKETQEPWFTFREGNHGSEPGVQAAFFKAWDSAVPAVTEALHNAVLTVNPQWNYAAQGE